MNTVRNSVNNPEILSDPSFFDKTSLIQLVYGLWSIFPILGVGLAFGFSAVAIPQLREPGSGIHATDDEESWIASVVPLTAPVGSLLSGYLTDRVGRRKLLISCQIPMFFGWFVSGCSSTASQIIIGRVLVGIGCGMSTLPPRIYMSEFSLPNMRGFIGALPILGSGTGIMLQALLGSVFSWRNLCWLCVVYSSIVFSINFMLPESPYYHLLKDNVDQAKETLRKFRAKNYNIETEMNDMIEYKMANDIHRLEAKQLIPALLQQSACKPFWIIAFFILLTQLSGVSIMTFYTVEILQDSRSVTVPTLGNIIISMARLSFGAISCILLYRIGRRPLIMSSGFGVGVSFIVLGVLTMKTTGPNVYALLCATSFVSFATIGYYNVPLMLMSEMYPLQIRGVLGGITVSFSNIIIFLCNKYYPLVKLTFGFSTTIIAMGVIAIVGVVYIFVVLPETKDLSLTEIEEYFNGRISTPLSHRMLVSMHAISARQSSLSANRGEEI